MHVPTYWSVVICCLIFQGGNETLAEAREKQLTDLRYSKLQKKVITYFLKQPFTSFAPLISHSHVVCEYYKLNNTLKQTQERFRKLLAFFPRCDGPITKILMWPVVSSWERRSWTRWGDKKRRRSYRRWKPNRGRRWDQDQNNKNMHVWLFSIFICVQFSIKKLPLNHSPTLHLYFSYFWKQIIKF